MTLKLYKCFPYILQVTDNMDINSNGQAQGPYVRIRKGKEGDKGLLYHELKHVQQWYYWILFLGIPHSLLYRYYKPYRQWSEVSAYRKQLEYDHPRYTKDELREMYAGWLSDPSPVTGYGLTLTKERALQLLS